uniref:Nucleocapsid protein n=1 Tax=Blattodean phasma-related virus OKIAV239 TaxID=2746318 RepID=A0A7D7F8J5_9VIRU|nr:nucleocapsid protein [Blattodean phasma-related virus OKIAV239]DAZ90401.1 TPA_asm: nucleocapsid protein [Supella longipalpa bunya-like virus]
MAATGLPSISLSDAISGLKLTDDAENRNAFSLAGQTPDEISKHTTAKDYYILGITPDEFIKQHGGAQFDFADLQKRFSQICRDFASAPKKGEKSRALEFASKIIYEVAPDARRVKKAEGDKVWKFHFPYNESGKIVVKTAFVCTFKSESAGNLSGTANKITLTIKQASLLALVTLCKINNYCGRLDPPTNLLTPLAGAVFSKDDISKIAGRVRKTVAEVTNIINSSCQSGGQYLDDSDTAVAAIASIVATSNMKDEAQRESIINKNVKQYLNMKKTFSVENFDIYAEYAHGGVPEGLRAKALIDLFNGIQKNAPNPNFRKAVQLSQQTAMTARVDVPNVGLPVADEMPPPSTFRFTIEELDILRNNDPHYLHDLPTLDRLRIGTDKMLASGNATYFNEFIVQNFHLYVKTVSEESHSFMCRCKRGNWDDYVALAEADYESDGSTAGAGLKSTRVTPAQTEATKPQETVGGKSQSTPRKGDQKGQSATSSTQKKTQQPESKQSTPK